MERRRRLAATLAASAAISVAGLRTRALAADGALAATVVGATILDRLSWRGGMVLGTFFVSSSALSRVARIESIAQRGSRRDLVQVLANGGVAAVAAAASSVIGERRALVIAAGSLAAATADTWATEIGSTSPAAPRLIVSRRPVVAGTSGAVTRRGIAGTLAGAGLIALLAYVVTRPVTGAGRDAVAVALAGVAGSLVDSVLGEMVQERRWCPACQKPTEARVHRCGHPTAIVGGVAGISNDVVNVACTAAGAVFAGAVAECRNFEAHPIPTG